MNCKCGKCGSDMQLVTVQAKEVPVLFHIRQITLIVGGLLSLATVVGGIFLVPIMIGVYCLMEQPVQMLRCNACSNWLFPQVNK